ncbi:MAG: hypothetical protein Q8R02_24890 [Hyphomonadaceae bacterium]|nr:hypothetical protein [Hyphomonadaceae bacterium]
MLAYRLRTSGMFVRFALASCVLAVAACSPKAATPDATKPDVARAGNPFFGAWKVETAQVAPWWDQQGAAPQMNAEFQNTTIVFEAGKSSGPKLLTCDQATYAVSIVAVQVLFEGNLPDPAVDAATLGLPPRDIDQLNFSCTSGGADVSLDFPMVDDDTILLGLDNMIYTLKRQPT